MQKVQSLQATDHLLRVKFFELLLQSNDRNSRVTADSLSTEEDIVTRNARVGRCQIIT